MSSQDRASKSIKLTDDEFAAFQQAAKDSDSESFREYCDLVLTEFLDENSHKTELVILKPVKSAGYRSIAISIDVASRLKKFAEQVDASANSVIQMAFKKSLENSNNLATV